MKQIFNCKKEKEKKEEITAPMLPAYFAVNLYRFL